MKCDNCFSKNASSLIKNDGEDPQKLCPKCLKILNALEAEYYDIISDGQTSSSHIEN